jgi:chaperonin GroEL (HSP60 family)
MASADIKLFINIHLARAYQPRRVRDVLKRTGGGGISGDAQTEVYENLVEAGVIDPTKVVQVALQNAASIASLLLTSDVAISENAA